MLLRTRIPNKAKYLKIIQNMCISEPFPKNTDSNFVSCMNYLVLTSKLHFLQSHTGIIDKHTIIKTNRFRLQGLKINYKICAINIFSNNFTYIGRSIFIDRLYKSNFILNLNLNMLAKHAFDTLIILKSRIDIFQIIS